MLVVLLFCGNVKEGLALLNHLLEELVRYPHILEIEEPDLHQGVPQLGQKPGLCGRVLGQRQIQNGD